MSDIEALDVEPEVAVPVDDTRDTLSPSALSSFEICGARGEHYKDPDIPRTNTLGTARGRAWHAAMEFYNTFPDLEQQSTIDMIDQLDAVALVRLTEVVGEDNFEWQEGDDFPEVLEQLHVMVESYCKAEPSVRWAEDGISTLAIERGVFADMGSPSHVMPGVIDVVKLVLPAEVGAKGTVVGVDYKSAGRAWGGRKALGDPRTVIQPPLYAEAWEQVTGDPMDWFAMDVMTVKGKFQRVWYPTSKPHRQPFIDRWKAVSAQIAMHQEQGLPMPTNPGHMLCSPKWCSYWDICPMGAEYDSVLNPSLNINTGTRVSAKGIAS